MNINHTNEQPLVTWGDIAAHLKVSQPTARKELKKKAIEVFMLGRCVAIYPSDLRDQLEKYKKLVNLP